MLKVWQTQDREQMARDQVQKENCSEIVKISRANLQRRAMCRTSTSVTPSSNVGVMSTSANKRRKLLSVLCSSSSDEVKSQQGHMAQLQ